MKEFAKTYKKSGEQEQIRHMEEEMAQGCKAALCRDCFERGKKYLCLFYDDPVAGRIYNRIGFQELGEYGMLS